MGNAKKVYLDTNIIILGEKCPECSELKRLANSGAIALFIGPDVLVEQEKRSLDTHFSTDPSMAITAIRAVLFKEDEIEVKEKKEWEFWRDTKLNYVECTFEGILDTLAILGENIARLMDSKGELDLCIEMITNYGIGVMDACHAMAAHSAGMDFLLTWDEKGFIRKSKDIKWLRPAVINPVEFIKYILQSRGQGH